jgi:SPP1 family predicted phage head-tail adaptor
MRSGELKNSIELQGQTRTPDGMGGFTNTFSTIDTVWAAIWPLKSIEAHEGGRVVATVTHRIRIRYREGVKASWRIKFKTKYFNIVEIINPNTDYKVLDLMAKEVL